jgi:hypothetical protein
VWALQGHRHHQWVAPTIAMEERQEKYWNRLSYNSLAFYCLTAMFFGSTI